MENSKETKEQLNNLLSKNSNDLLLDLGKQLYPSLGVKKPNKTELILRANTWLATKQSYFREKICSNPVVISLSKDSFSNKVELAITIYELIVPDFDPTKALLIAAIIINRGLNIICNESV